ncbi:MAG: carboxypeptidase-like regulatory domain-containing protein [Candidatus Thermoplasmatota archaeon]
MRTTAILASLLFAALAGCAQGSGDATSSGPEPNVDVEATSTTGIIRGVVVDSTITPILDAIVSIQVDGQPRTNLTNSNGGFGFEGLEPGTYFVSASKAGFSSGQTSVEVVAGDNEPPVARIALEADGSFIGPYSQVSKFDGFIACGVSTAAITAAVCSIVNIAAPVFDDRFITVVDVSPNPSFAQHEIIWDDNQPVPQQFNHAQRAVYADGSFDDIGNVIGPSPIIGPLNQSVLREFDVGNETDLFPTVFAGGADGSIVCVPAGLPLAGFCTFGTGVTFEQRFELYTTVTYGFVPPEGFTFIADGKPVPPA